MSAITTHVLDTSLGRPAEGLRVVLERGGRSSEWQIVGHGVTDEDGRLRTLMADQGPIEPGLYRLVFDTRRYFEARALRAFYPSVIITFEVAAEPGQEPAHLRFATVSSRSSRGSRRRPRSSVTCSTMPRQGRDC